MRSELEIRQLRVFVALAHRGSFRSAARALGVAQSTVSETLAALERTLGAAVISRRRGSHEMSLTVAGRALLPHATQVLAAMEAARVAVAEVDAHSRATVSIIANESISTYVLPGVLSTLRESWPCVGFSVSVATCDGVRSGVEAGEFGLGLLLGTPGEGGDAGTGTRSGAGHVVASGVPLIVFAGPENPLVRGGEVPVVHRSEISRHTLYLSDAAGDFHVLVRRYFEEDALPPPRLESAGSVEAVKRGVLATPAALGVLPGYALLEELQTRHAIPVAIRPAPPSMRIEAVLSERRVPHPAVHEMLAAIQAQFSRSAAGDARRDGSAPA